MRLRFRYLAVVGAAVAVALATATPAVASAHAATLFQPGVISTGQQEWRITFTPDGRTAYFARDEGSWFETRSSTIMVTHRRGSGWSQPQVASFSGTYADIDPYLTPDGQRLYFSSIRPVAGQVRQDADLWMVQRTASGGWSEAVHLGAAVNSPGDDLYPTVTEDGTLFVGADRPGGFGGYDIWVSTPDSHGVYGEPVNAGPGVNSDAWEFNPVVVPGSRGKLLVFAALFRTDSIDLFYSAWSGGQFGPARELGPAANTAEHGEMHPSFSPSGDRFYFVRSANGTELGDLYTVSTAALLCSTLPS